jgi:DNA repair protein RadA/Sms
MSKIFECAKCGAQTQKWEGRCRECGNWGTVQENEMSAPVIKKQKANFSPLSEADIVDFSKVVAGNVKRIATGELEIDRVLGGGLVPGSLLLLGGDPGIGKSTLVLQIAELLGNTKQNTFYISGEESAEQIKTRIERMHIDISQMKFVASTQIGAICATLAKHKPTLAIVDSIQTMNYEEVDAEAGSLSQIRAISAKLMETAKQYNICIVLIGHVTKEGKVAGPRTMEHLVDVVLYLEGDKHQQYRILRSVKNRFGSTGEVGIFKMGTRGLDPVKDPAGIFVQSQQFTPGLVHSVMWEGSRAFLVEVQALTSSTNFGYPKRTVNGLDYKRVEMLLAVLQKRARVNIGSDDVFINLAGGITSKDTGLDLGVCIAIASAKTNIAFAKPTVAIGEVSLSGQVRAPAQIEKRVREATRLGYSKIIIPKTNIKITSSKVKIIQVASVMEAVNEVGGLRI